jgi:uncharacterized protein YjbJ (UPF0337 family)
VPSSARRTRTIRTAAAFSWLYRRVVEEVKGKARKVIGSVTGNDDLVDEGKAQQDKADAQRDAAMKEAEAKKARGEAKASEARQRAASSNTNLLSENRPARYITPTTGYVQRALARSATHTIKERHP